jgi:hypothetical protein
MSSNVPNASPLCLAVRAYPTPEKTKQKQRSRKTWRCPDAMFVFDTETRLDPTQTLTFGSYRFIVSGRCLEEGLFYAPDLPELERQVLERYVKTHSAETVGDRRRQLRLLTLREFVDRLYQAVYKGRCLLVGFNLPFDLSRVAYDFTSARGRFAGGFALELWSYIDSAGIELPDSYRPRICIKHIDSKRALKGFTTRRSPDREDLIPEDAPDGEPEDGFKFRGHFLDLRMLAFSLTDRSYSLESACEAFGVEHGKTRATSHGEVTEEYIDYNRRDVLATSELAVKLLEEYARHPIPLQATKAYSPASIGKAYLRGMGISPILERQPDFPKSYLGFAQTAFAGGRTSAHIRKVPVPVVYTDFLSMYPTVNSLMDLWQFVIANKIRIVAHCKQEIQTFLSNLTRERLFDPTTWRALAAFVKILPDGDILPARSKYSSVANDYQVGINYIYSEGDDAHGALWFSLPDVVASVILTGRIPKIVDAFRLEPVDMLPGLKPIKLRGAIEVDPRKQDFFKVAIEERKRLAPRKDLSESEKERLGKNLKVLSTATGYGIYAEMNRRESDEEVSITCYGIDAEGFTCRVAHPDVPGEYCFPPLAALTTGGARLMLALLESCVAELGGTYAMEDTDSMAIVATERGGMVPCKGGPFRTKDGRAAIKALPRKQVMGIAERFAALKPYDHRAVPGSILKIEDDNFDPKTGKPRQVYCLAISAKRYALFLKDRKGSPALLRKGVNNHEDRWSEHGLGHLLNPTNPEDEDRDWIAQAWLRMIRKALALPVQKLDFEDMPAVGRITASSPAVMKSLAALNDGKKYAAQIKPFNFLLTCHVKQLGHPAGADPERFHLIAPYELDPRQWLKMMWIDQYTGNQYRITTAEHHGNRKTVRVKTYGEVLREYEFHAEAKCAAADGTTCEKQTIGLLQRRHVRVDLIKYIGKESNHLEDVDAGLIHTEQSVYTEYPDERRDEWTLRVLPLLKRASLLLLIEKSGLSRRALLNIRAGRSRPHRKNRELLAEVVGKLGLI